MGLRILLMRVANAVLFYTEREVEEYKARLGRHDERPILALNNGVNIAPIQIVRKTYLAGSRQREILFVGRLTPKAEILLLVQALALPQMKGIHLHVVGEGEESARARTAAETAGVSERITWHGISTDEAVVGAIANRCRLFVYPGQVGLSLIHAMAYGLPCIVHSDRWHHMPEIAAFETGRTGRAFKPDDAEDLATVIANVIDDIDLLDCFSARCIEITETSFNTNNMAERFMDLVKRLQ
ncbi:glycosyltransferase family 4 protein [Paracoccus tibetensis]|nr:glycosyltransferase family 4 protein [Paracoccus tibetensis]